MNSSNNSNNKNTPDQTQQKFNTVEYIEYLRNLNQEGPHLGNQYLEDTALQSYIKQFLPDDVRQFAEKREHGFIELGDAVAGDILEANHDCENNKPRLESHDAFGKRQNFVVLSWGWRQQRMYAAKYHIVGTAYSNIQGYGQHSRFIQCIKNYLYQPSSGLYGCPLAMTDGCAYVLKNLLENEKFLDEKRRSRIEKVYNRLISNDPKQFQISGQWMTEKRGGTDVNNTTETIAIQYKENKYKLYGYKFFCSAADCDVTLALARIVDPNKQYLPDEIRKLPVSMFLIKLNKKDGTHNGLEYQTLKDKLGTRQLPTAEMILNGSKATLVSPPGRGIKYIVNMLQTTRLYNSATAVGYMRRMIALCRDYSDRRSVFGKKLMDLPMHIKLMNDMEVTFRGNLLFYLKISYLFGKVQEGIATVDEQNLARLGSPLLKMFTAKEVQTITSEGLEIFGGIGYCENSKLPQIYRDAQVLPIWEGTTNVQAHDFHRALTQKNNPINSFSKYVSRVLMDNTSSGSKLDGNNRFLQCLKNSVTSYNELIADITSLKQDKQKYQNFYEYIMRDIAMGTSRIFCSVLLLEQFLKSGEEQDLEIYLRWNELKPLYNPDKKMNIQLNKQIAMDQNIIGELKGNGNKDLRGKLRPKF